ncbi:MAG: sugar phosphate isomerase/epimerase family protein [Reyranellaceae bacterium]
MPAPRDPLRDVSLCWLTIADADHVELVEVAANAGFGAVGLKLAPRPGDPVPAVAGDERKLAQVRAALHRTGLKALNMGGVWIAPEFDLHQLEPSLNAGAELGARYLIAVGIDPDRSRTVDNLAALQQLAGRYGISTLVEFTIYTQIRTLADTRSAIGATGRDGMGILLDALHFCRSGGTPAELAVTANDDIVMFHLCDAPARPPEDLRFEGRSNRLFPGQGELPLVALLQSLPRAIVEVEAPSQSKLPPRERAMAVAEATRDVLGRLAQ